MCITLFGIDYNGIMIAVGLAKLGHQVIIFHTDRNKIRRLQRGFLTESDASPSPSLRSVISEGVLTFSASPESSLALADVVVFSSFSTTRSKESTTWEMILKHCECMAGVIASFRIVLVTAQVSHGTCRKLQNWLNYSLPTGAPDVVAWPISFTPPNGLEEFHNPERLILGYEKESSRRVVDELLAGLLVKDPLVYHVSWEVAEMMRGTDVIATGILSSQKNNKKTTIKSLHKEARDSQSAMTSSFPEK